MTAPQLALIGILLGLFALMVWGRWRYDVVAFAGLMVAVLIGIVPAGEAFAGFGHPATVTVAAVLIVSRALANSGATDWIGTALRPALARTWSHVGALAGIAAAISGFMNNVGALGLLMPVALQSARTAKRSAATILMPLSFGSILGGLVTLIGTPPNIIIATERAQILGAPFGMFDFAPVGAATALAGLLFVTVLGWRLVPAKARARASVAEVFDIDSYLAEASVPEQSEAVGKTLRELEATTEKIDALIVGLIRRGRMVRARSEPVEAGDILVVEAGHDDLDKFVSALKLELGGKKDDKPGLSAKDSALVEAVVAPRSRLEGQPAGNQRLLRRHGFTLLAVARQGRRYRGRLNTLRFQVGDVVLLHGESDRIADALAAFGVLPLAERGVSMGQRRHAVALMCIFFAAIAAATLGLLPIAIALSLAVAAMVLAGLIPVRDLYEGIDWPVIILLGSLIPVGAAIATTGTSDVIASTVERIAAGGSAVPVLVLLMVLTMTLSDVLNNAATAVVMAPLSVGIAQRLEVNPDPFLMAVAVGASCAFLTPIGHQNNALIMGPGGYRFGDYWRMGLPLEAVIVAVAVPMILLVWPL